MNRASPVGTIEEPEHRRDPVVTSSREEWSAFAGLIVLGAVPIVAGAARLGQLSGGATVTPENARFFAAPFPVVVHIIAASLFCVLGAFQFVPHFRRRHRGWHRAAGRILIPLGLAAAISGLWMTVFSAHTPHDGELLLVLRLIFGSGMALSLVLGFAAVRRRDYAQHSAWMMRSYAIALGAGTQVLTAMPWLLLGTQPSELGWALSMAAGWLLNLAVVERIIRRSTQVVPAAALAPGDR